MSVILSAEGLEFRFTFLTTGSPSAKAGRPRAPPAIMAMELFIMERRLKRKGFLSGMFCVFLSAMFGGPVRREVWVHAAAMVRLVSMLERVTGLGRRRS